MSIELINAVATVGTFVHCRFCDRGAHSDATHAQQQSESPR
jgi:hypothetical protein